MADAEIPVDLFNPGQVFACLGFLEAANTLLGDAEGSFDWSNETNVRFRLRGYSDKNPFVTVLDFIATATVTELEPTNWPGPSSSGSQSTSLFPSPLTDHRDEKKKWSRTKLPIRFVNALEQRRVELELLNWADGSSRPSFKLYSGNRSALTITQAMLCGTRGNPTRKDPSGPFETKGIVQLWHEQREALTERPFDVLTPMGGSFNFDPRGAWTAIDAGYSPNDQDHQVTASPVVELLAAWGMEHARPNEYETRKVRYAAWGLPLDPMVARVALFGGISSLPLKRFRFELALSGKNKVVTYADQEFRS